RRRARSAPRGLHFARALAGYQRRGGPRPAACLPPHERRTTSGAGPRDVERDPRRRRGRHPYAPSRVRRRAGSARAPPRAAPRRPVPRCLAGRPAPGPMSDAHPLGAIVALLDAAGIPHMLTGSFASTFHGSPRSTRDIDLVIDPTPASLDGLLRAL